MNVIKMEIKHSIITLHNRGWSKSAIARELGIDRKTVRRKIESLEGSKGPVSTTGKSGRQSHCDHFKKLIEEKLALGLHGQRIYQDLCEEVSFAGSYESVKRYVRQIKQSKPQLVYRVEVQPGEEAQIDYLEGYYLINENGNKAKVNILRVSLSHSRKGYSQAGKGQDTESFIRALENAFRYFGGVPKYLCTDNLKAAVLRADWYDPDLNPKMVSFTNHYATLLMPTRPRMPQHKGKVENAVKYVKNNALKGRTFKSIAALNEHLKNWESQIADQRIHGTIRKQVGSYFETVEKPQLGRLPGSLFPCFEEGKRRVQRDGFIEVKRSFYHVKEEYLRENVWVRWDQRMVNIFDLNMKPIISHARLEPGKFSWHLNVQGTRKGLEHSIEYWHRKVTLIGENASLWVTRLIEQRGEQSMRVLQGLSGLKEKYTYRQIDAACAKALLHGQYRLKEVKNSIAVPWEQECFSYLEEHELIRPMQAYRGFQTEELFATEK
jgi:transposase